MADSSPVWWALYWHKDSKKLTVLCLWHSFGGLLSFRQPTCVTPDAHTRRHQQLSSLMLPAERKAAKLQPGEKPCGKPSQKSSAQLSGVLFLLNFYLHSLIFILISWTDIWFLTFCHNRPGYSNFKVSAVLKCRVLWRLAWKLFYNIYWRVINAHFMKTLTLCSVSL